MQLEPKEITKRLSKFSDIQLQEMKTAVEKTRQQYVDGFLLSGRCPLCLVSLAISGKNGCQACPHLIFNQLHCLDWIKKNSVFKYFTDIFYSSHSAVIKKKCIARHDSWLKMINYEIKRRKK